MKNWLFFLLSIEFQALARDVELLEKPYPAYLSTLEEGQTITVFSKPGLTSKNCKKKVDSANNKSMCENAVGWPGRDANISVIGKPVEVATIDPLTEVVTKDSYVKINFTYTTLGQSGEIKLHSGTGYIDQEVLTTKKLPPIYSKNRKQPLLLAKPTKKKICVSASATASSALVELANTMGELKEVAMLAKNKRRPPNLSVLKSAQALSHLVGFCPLSPATKFPEKKLLKGNPYDNLVYPRLKRAKLPYIAREDRTAMTHDDLINIDSMARTLYGEMAQCYKYGLHYPMAVAKIILNRVERGEVFVKKPHIDKKPLLSKVSTSLSQFSMWQPTKKAKGKILPNEPLHQGLCPPKDLGKPFYNGPEAPEEEYEIWQQTLKIATEAVLYPTTFAGRTAKVRDFHYTSNLSHYRYKPLKDIPSGARFIKKMTQVKPKINDLTVNINKCLEIWKE